MPSWYNSAHWPRYCRSVLWNVVQQCDLMAPRRQRDSAHWPRGRSHYRRYVWTCWYESPPIDPDGLYSDMECCTATRQVHAESEESPRDEKRGERHLVSQWEDGKLGQKWRRTNENYLLRIHNYLIKFSWKFDHSLRRYKPNRRNMAYLAMLKNPLKNS